jgi:YD repeat-containing protein
MLFFLASPAFSASTSYVYDELDRLHEVTLENGNKITYEYDQIGNILSKGFNNSLNVALQANGGVATASSSYSSNYPASSVNVGNRAGLNWGAGGGWADGTPNVFPDWVQITFSGQKTIEEIDVYTVQDNYQNPVEPTSGQTFSLYGNTAFDVRYWNGTSWITVPGGSITGNNLVWRKITFPPVATNQIRIQVNASVDGLSHITEIEAYTANSFAPTVSITAPSDGAAVSGVVAVTASASGIEGVSGVNFYANGVLLATATSAPYTFNWDTISCANGNYTLVATAYDAVSNNMSSSVNVAVYNALQGFDTSTTIPPGWSVQGYAAITNSTNHSTPNSLQLGDFFNTDGSVSFVAPVTGKFSFWYYKLGVWGYYLNDAEWIQSGVNVGTMTVSVNGIVAYTVTADTGWMKSPLFSMYAGDTIKIAQAGNSDDGGAYCNQIGGSCRNVTDDRYYNVLVNIDDVTLLGGATVIDTTPPITTATPGGGTYTTAQTVTLSANEPATIYYTTDGTTPTMNSTVYSVPLAISANTTLKYFARDLAGNNEAAKTLAYFINLDTTPPITSATPGGGTYFSPQTVTLTANEPATIYYTTNGTLPTTSSTVYSTPLTISANATLMYFARDLAGNNEAVNTQTYLINSINPDTGSIIQSTPGTYTHTFTTNCTVTLSYLKGAGGGGADRDGMVDGLAGYNSSITCNGTTEATANGGGGGFEGSNGTKGTASNSIGGTNTTGAGGAGGAEYNGYTYYGNGGAGGAVTGGSFTVTSGKVITVVVGDINSNSASAGWDGTAGSVSLSWH